MMRPSILPLACTVALSACAAEPAARLVPERQAIVGGAVDSDDYPAVCGIEIAPPPDDDNPDPDPIFCTGTLVGERVVLTSARCVAENVDAEMLDGIDVRFGFGFSEPDAQAIAVEEAAVYRYYRPQGGSDGLALLLLEEAPDGIEPVEIGTDPLDAELVGTEVTLVGFGATLAGEDAARVRNKVATPITRVSDAEVGAGTADATTCAGDGGAPVFLDDVVIAMTEQQGDCDANVGRLRLDPYAAAFVHAYVDRFEGACAVDDACTTDGCRTADPDCDESGCAWDGACVEACPTRDWDCALGTFVGDACEADGECEEGGRCVAATDDASFTYCSRPCEPSDDEACPTDRGMACEAGEGDVDECQFGVPSEGSQGFACTSGAQCRSGICEDQICVFECDGPSDCAEPYVCGPSDESPGKDVCLGQDLDGGGGFCAAGGRSAAGWLAGLIALALVAARRRRRG
jgi:MYXO-CTERM domain-containing protein